MEGSACRISFKEKLSGHLSQSNGSDHHRETETKNCDAHAGHAGPVVGVGLEPRMDVSDKKLPVPHTTKVMSPTPAFVSIKLYVKFIRPNVAYANSCIPTLRVASRSGSRFIQYERRLTVVRRPAHEGLEAASCQTEPGEEN